MDNKNGKITVVIPKDKRMSAIENLTEVMLCNAQTTLLVAELLKTNNSPSIDISNIVMNTNGGVGISIKGEDVYENEKLVYDWDNSKFHNDNIPYTSFVGENEYIDEEVDEEDEEETNVKGLYRKKKIEKRFK